jgi:TBC1 domain family member 15
VKDVNRTDRNCEYFAGEDNPHLDTLNNILMSYMMYNFDLGYVQGMSDLLSPILMLMNNEPDAFWCFAGFMDKVVRARHHPDLPFYFMGLVSRWVTSCWSRRA